MAFRILLITIAVLVAGCRSMSKEPDTPPEALQATWQCSTEVRDTQIGGKIPVDVVIIIGEDGRVTGKVGDAAISGSVFQFNRGELSRKLNIKTDYIIHHGSLDGAIYQGDIEQRRMFSIPFRMEDGKLVGTIMSLEGALNVKPLTSQLQLEPVIVSTDDAPSTDSEAP